MVPDREISSAVGTHVGFLAGDWDGKSTVIQESKDIATRLGPAVLFQIRGWLQTSAAKLRIPQGSGCEQVSYFRIGHDTFIKLKMVNSWRSWADRAILISSFISAQILRANLSPDPGEREPAGLGEEWSV